MTYVKPINREFTPEVGMALATKNGQRCGNGFIISDEYKTYTRIDCEETYHLFHVLTDFGNLMTLTEREVVELYDVADWWGAKIMFGLSQSVNPRCPVARIKHQIALLTEVLNELEEKE